MLSKEKGGTKHFNGLGGVLSCRCGGGLEDITLCFCFTRKNGLGM